MRRKIGLYNKIAKYYDIFDSFYEKKIYHTMREKYITRITNAKILEVGVGTGKNLPYYSSNNELIIGIDQSVSMIREAYKKKKNLPLEVSRIIKLYHVNETWHFKENEFDVVVATFVLCTNDDPTYLIQNIFRTLKQDGLLLLFEWVPNDKGLRKTFLKIIHPIVHFFLGVSVYRSNSLHYFNKSDWIFQTKEFFDRENIVVLLKKKDLIK